MISLEDEIRQSRQAAENIVAYDPRGVMRIQPTAPQQPVEPKPQPQKTAPSASFTPRPVLPPDTVAAPASSVAMPQAPRRDTPTGLSFESQLAAARILGTPEDRIIDKKMSSLKDGEELRDFQKELLKGGYYKNLPTPAITAKTKDEVIALQTMLKDAGYDLGSYGANKDGIDGQIGAKTRAAWAQYVKDHPSEALEASAADGRMGPATRAAAKAYYSHLAEYANTRPTYDKVLEKPTRMSQASAIAGGVNDAKNLERWKDAVTKAREVGHLDEEGIPVVDMPWDVSDDQLTRLASLLPKGLKAGSQRAWVTSDKREGDTRYPTTWDSEEYREANRTAMSEALSGMPGVAGRVGQALAQPGRGTIGGFSYRTTPEGIEISDGYEFHAPAQNVMISDNQSESYNDLRSRMNVEYRGKNERVQHYLIPWDVYNQLSTGR